MCCAVRSPLQACIGWLRCSISCSAAAVCTALCRRMLWLASDRAWSQRLELTLTAASPARRCASLLGPTHCCGFIIFRPCRYPHLHPTQVLCITGAIAVTSWLAVGGALLGLASKVPFLKSLPPHELRAVASLGGTLAVTRSPASAVRGPCRKGVCMQGGPGIGGRHNRHWYNRGTPHERHIMQGRGGMQGVESREVGRALQGGLWFGCCCPSKNAQLCIPVSLLTLSSRACCTCPRAARKDPVQDAWGPRLNVATRQG